jgi:hypothetical protein
MVLLVEDGAYQTCCFAGSLWHSAVRIIWIQTLEILMILLILKSISIEQ